jgi:hypothetical protein
MYPWGAQCAVPLADEADLYGSSKVAVDALKALYGTSYKFGGACKTIYQASGVSVDHFYANRNVKYAVAVELRDTGRNGFNLPPSQIVPTGEETVAALVAFWNYVKNH